jgi:hypothetical protein
MTNLKKNKHPWGQTNAEILSGRATLTAAQAEVLAAYPQSKKAGRYYVYGVLPDALAILGQRGLVMEAREIATQSGRGCLMAIVACGDFAEARNIVERVLSREDGPATHDAVLLAEEIDGRRA